MLHCDLIFFLRYQREKGEPVQRSAKVHQVQRAERMRGGEIELVPAVPSDPVVPGLPGRDGRAAAQQPGYVSHGDRSTRPFRIQR